MATNQTLRDFIAARKAEIKALMDELRRELRDLQAAEAAIAGPAVIAPTPRVTSSKPTIKAMFVEVLRDHPAGGEAADILGWVRDKFGVEVARTSASPQLSRLKSDGIVELDDTIWRLASSDGANNDEAPESDHSGASVTGGDHAPSDDDDVKNLL